MSKKIDFHALLTFKFWKEMMIITVAMFIAAAAVYFFLMPSNLVIGSISGLSMVISSLFGGAIKVSTLVLIINSILLILAYFLIGADFGLKTAYSALILGPLMDLWALVCPYENLIEPGNTSIMGDIWFDLLCFVLVLSASQAILFQINASTGGLDIIAKIVNKYFHFNIGTCVTIAGFMICCTAFFVNPFQLVIVGLIGTWINGLIVDYFMISISRKKKVCVIAGDEDLECIRVYITEKLQRGCTLYEVTGGFSKRKHTELVSIMTKDEFVDLMSYIRNNEIRTFITADNLSEVYGKWTPKKSIF